MEYNQYVAMVKRLLGGNEGKQLIKYWTDKEIIRHIDIHDQVKVNEQRAVINFLEKIIRIVEDADI